MLESGAVLQNRYRIVSELGQGGMGTVYLAEDLRFGTQVALKETSFDHTNLINLRSRDRARLRKAFIREARLLNRLRHRALPHVIDYFAEVQGQYLVMQFIDGSDLDELLARRIQKNLGAFPVAQALEWADQLLDALEYLHEQRTPIIHRDIKPRNLKLTKRGDVTLLDFGLAKGAVTEMSELSASFRGYTPHYAPLEQIEGTGTDPRSDLYSLAATLYRLITGELPPLATTRAATILNGLPDPLRPANELNPETPVEVAETLARAMAQTPAARPATAREMRILLRQAGRSCAQSKDLPDPAGNRIPQTEDFVPLNKGSDALTLRPANADTRESGYRGPLDPLRTTFLLRKSFGPNPVSAWAARAALGVLIFLGAAFVTRDGREHLSRASSPPVELMKYRLTVESTEGEEIRLAGDKPLAAGQRFKLHFTPSERGYLYIIMPGVNETPTTFLTFRPNPDWGVTTNRIDAGASYTFPPRPDNWLRITGDVETQTYLIVFAPAPLSEPGFWTEPAGRRLTESEQSELAAFRRRHWAEITTRQSDDQSVVFLSGQRSTGAPLAFEIKLR